jgi:Ca2+-transporting ATPase
MQATASPQSPASHAHTLDDAMVCDLLGSSPAGLSSTEAAQRLVRHGPNALTQAPRVSAASLLAAQFRNVLVLILLAATALSALLGHGVEAIAITVIVLFAVLLGFVQEYRAERAMAALRAMSAPVSIALRDGEEVEVAAHDLVPGDVIVLTAGSQVPADARLLHAASLQTLEAALTGESTPVEKHTQPIADADAPVGDRVNMVFAGTSVGRGRGRALVTATGMATEFGRIAHLLRTAAPGRTPLQINLDRLAGQLARAALAVVIVIIGVGLARGQPLIEMLVFGIALAVAVVPEALPAVVTISLAIGAQRLARRHALMRRLSAVETLGSTTVICSDKTGTLTRDEMTVRRIWLGGEWIDVAGSGYAPEGGFSHNGAATAASPALRLLLTSAALCTDAHLRRAEDGHWRVKGDPTEGALIAAAAKAGLHKPELEQASPRIDELPFDADSRRMSTLHRQGDSTFACVKGAAEAVLAACTRLQRTDGSCVPLDAEHGARVLAAADAMAGQALRVIAVARRDDATRDSLDGGLVLLGLFGMIDPPRPEARPALDACRRAGIRVMMITGDHPATAAAIARDLDLLGDGRVVTGAQLDALDDAALAQEIERIAVCARVSPAHKLRIVQALQSRGHVVAMTGDGVNDAPALRRADIGVAMGVSGTDVAREAAAMTLTDDNFATIVAAIEEGRAIFANIRKYLMFLLGSNIGEIGLMTGAALFGLPLPLTAVQILYVNLATDGLPALALAVDPADPDLGSRQPRDPRQGIFTRPVVTLMLAAGLWSALVNLALFAWLLHGGRDPAAAMTMTFVCLVLLQFFSAYGLRSDRTPIWRRPFANRWLNLAILWEIGLLALIVYLPALQGPFATAALSASDLLLVLAVAASVVPVIEIAKAANRRGK